MRVTIERLRAGILVLAGLLVAGILLFFAFARWQLRRIGHDLPGKLGISVEQSTNGYTFSRSEGGHTSLTLHAAKMVRYKKGGHMALQDVSITLYGPAGTLPDRIYGKDFDYDPVEGLVRANGAVQIDLHGPAGVGLDNGAVHVQTADLTFNQKTGLATTPQRLEFRIAEASGSATGASFDSRVGVLVLDGDVTFNSTVNGSPLAGRASHARFDRVNRLLYLSQCSTEYASSHSSSDQATVHFRLDGSAERIDGQGHVAMSDGVRKMTSGRGYAKLDRKSQPKQVVLQGGVHYDAEDEEHHLRGTAAEGTLSFGPQNSVHHAQLRNAVSIVDEEKTPPEASRRGAPSPTASAKVARDVEASQIDVDFTSLPDRRPLAQDIVAAGGARLNIHTFYPSTPPQVTEVQGDRLLISLRNGDAVSSLRGSGHTRLATLAPNGVQQTSTGNNILMTFAPATGAVTAVARQQAMQIQSSEQQGNVVLLQRVPAANAGAPPVETMATAQRATYDASSQRVTLYGEPHLRDSAGDLSAGTIQFERGNGNALATGGVKATYRQISGQQGGSPAVSFGSMEPVHVVADHARLDRGTGLSIFYGEGGEDARLWQEDDSISAPVLELSREKRTLSAHGANGSDAEAVKAVLISQGPSSPRAGTPGKPGQSSVVRVISRTMLYSDATNQAVFRGGVAAEDAPNTMQAEILDIHFSSKRVDRMIAQGNVQLDQPGREATGHQLVYTSEDGRFVLTGTGTALPRLVDQVHGTVIGASLIFNDRDDSVIVSGGLSKAVTETRTAK